MVQVPLSRLSSAFCFLTAFLAWLLDYKTKQEIYNLLQYVLWRVANPRSKPKKVSSDLDLPSFASAPTEEISLGERFKGQQREEHKSVVDWTVFHFFVFMSVFCNFLAQSFLQQVVALGSKAVIRMADSLGLEMHFVRFLYWTIYDHSGSGNLAKIERYTLR